MRALTRIADRARMRAIGRTADAMRAAVPGARIETSGEDIVIEGRGLRSNARLRWIAGWLR